MKRELSLRPAPAPPGGGRFAPRKVWSRDGRCASCVLGADCPVRAWSGVLQLPHVLQFGIANALTSPAHHACGERRRPGAPVQQTMKAARGRQGTKRGADHIREDQAWSERHGIEQQMSVTRFAAPSFFCLRHRCSRSTPLQCATSPGTGISRRLIDSAIARVRHQPQPRPRGRALWLRSRPLPAHRARPSVPQCPGS